MTRINQTQLPVSPLSKMSNTEEARHRATCFLELLDDSALQSVNKRTTKQ
jgi:hypothetical protein